MRDDRLPSPDAFDRFEHFGITAGAIVVAIGGLALLGWALDVRILQSFYPGWVTMKANTAFALTLGGGALLLHGRERSRSRLGTVVARTLGGIVAIIGAATAAHYMFGIDLRVDQLLFSVPTDARQSATPGRMALVTALAFMLIGGALAMIRAETRRGRRIAQPLAVGAGALGLAALLGYIYGAIPTVGPGQGIQIAIHAAIAIVLLAAGTLALEARAGWMPTLVSRHAGGELARRLLPLAFLVPVALGALRDIGEFAGMADVLDGAAVAVATMLAFAAVIWRTARAVNEVDAHWQAAEQERLTLVAQEAAAREVAIVERAGRESAEQAVHAKEDALRLLNLVLDSTPVGFALFDHDLRVRRANPAFTEMTGAVENDHLLGMVDDVVPEHYEAVAKEFRHVLTTGEPIINVERVDHEPTTRRRRHWLTSKYPVRSREGQIIGVGLTLLETTERKALEAQLQQAQKMEAIGQLAGGVAHDFNNVLTAIKSFGELVATSLPPESHLHDDVAEIISAADRGTALTRQLLAFSRQQRLEPTIIDPNTVVEGVMKLLSRLIGSEIRCVTSLAPELGHVLADPGQLEQVIVNLAVNARDAMPDGGTLAIETSNVTLDGHRVKALAGSEAAHPGAYTVLAVSDTGQGISAATQARMFDPFFTTKDPGKGTGLGLSTVYGIVRQSHGYLGVASELGRGTTFSIYLPRVDGDLDVPVAKPANDTWHHGSETILLVDDDDAVRTVLVRVLTRTGFNVLPAASPREAESICAEHPGPIHLLMTDLMMPGMTGDELAQRLLAARPEARVLYTSGYTDEAVTLRGLVSPGTPFLSKPFTIEGVVTKVREALALRSRAVGGGQPAR
ncbi:MAG: PAS domain-containing protein [Gemmatimonadaceae bacterium]